MYNCTTRRIIEAKRRGLMGDSMGRLVDGQLFLFRGVELETEDRKEFVFKQNITGSSLTATRE